ncbi:MAG: flagellar hook-basal body complex protein [Rhodospirillales bacterium]
MTADDGSTIQVDSGFLTDKNGYYVLGIPVQPDGTFDINATPQTMRLDAFAFSDLFQATSTGSLTMNLPANAETTDPQVDALELLGAIEAGDVYSVTVNGTTVSHTVVGGDTANTVRDALINSINANATTSAAVTASAGGTGVIRLTGAQILSNFTASGSAVNGGILADNGMTQTTLQSADATTTENVFSFQMIDSLGNLQNIRLNLDKIDENSWELRTFTQQTPTAQVDTVTLGGTVEAGDQYSITVGGQNIIYTVTGLEPDIDTIRNNVIGALNNNSTIANSYTLAATANAGEFTITANAAGTPFTTTVSAIDPNVAQVDTVTIGGTFGALEAGDTYSVTVNGTTVTYTVTGADTLASARANLIAAINADPTLGPLVTAAPGGGAGDITITADTPGTPFTATAAATDILGGVNDSTAITVTTTTGSNGDNTAAVATTTANVVAEVVGNVNSLTFNGAGLLTSTSPLNLTFTFQGGATGAMSLDLTDVTQFAGTFLVQDFARDGYARALMQSFGFNSDGEVVGLFDDGTSRTLYRLPLAQFVNADGLGRLNGNTFVRSELSGDVSFTFPGSGGFASLSPNTHELSNVDIATEFTNMIKVQTAYNSASKVFTTIDEMLTTARDLKR